MEEMGTEVSNCKEDSKRCSFIELGERYKKAEARIVELELEIEKRKLEYDKLEAKFKELHTQNAALEGDGVVEFTKDKEEEETVVDHLMVKNHVLECEKRKVESEVAVWKKRFIDLELWVLEVDESTILQGGKQLLVEVIKGVNGVKTGVEQLQVKEKSVDLVKGGDDSPAADILCGHTPLASNKGIFSKSEGDNNRVAIRHLLFEEERSPGKKIAPSTPGGVKSAGLNVINICDSDDESDIPRIQTSIPIHQGIRNRDDCLKTVTCSQVEDDVDDCMDNVPTPKRKRAARMVTSDTESDEEDHVPLSKLKRIQSIRDKAPPMNDDIKGIVTHSRGKRLATLRQCGEKVNAERVDESDAGEHEEVGSESLNGKDDSFIDDSSDVSNADNVISQSEDESDSSVDLGEILSKFRRSKDHKLNWELEADMLSAFANDLELCMKAVCALYRQQTSDEQMSKETRHQNDRGFSKFDALRGTELAVFLTDGDPNDDLKKSVEELEDQGADAVELCRTLAYRYSKQLFAIYMNKEDPLFLPS